MESTSVVHRYKFVPRPEFGVDEYDYEWIMIDGEKITTFPCDIKEIDDAIDMLNQTAFKFLLSWYRAHKVECKPLNTLPREVLNNILRFIAMPPYMFARKKITSRSVCMCHKMVATRTYLENLYTKVTTVQREEKRKKKAIAKNFKMIARAENRKQNWKHRK